MSEAKLIGTADVIVVGGGIGGCSAAYHLAKCGVKRVLLLERGRLSSGTTWHSTGNMETYREDPLMYRMVRYGVECMAEVQSESGQDIGWRNVGRVMYTDSEARMELLRAMPETGKALGIEVETLTPAGVAERLPIIDPETLIGGAWIPSDARLNPTDLVMAFARAARRRGVQISEHTSVLGLALKGTRVCGVVTEAGTFECASVVVSAGLWSNEVLASSGLRLPLHALEHQYLITQPIAGVSPRLPLFLSWEDQIYGREEVGALIVGTLDDQAIPVDVVSLPPKFSFSLLNERWSQFEPYMSRAMRRFPQLASAGVKMLLNGPESFTPDGRMLLGPVPGVDGLYSACGFNSNGIALAPSAGRFIAEWIVEGAASIDITSLDVRRFSRVQTAEEYVRKRVTEIPGFACRLHEPTDDYQTSRDIRCSPIHHALKLAGARFTSINAWERVAYVAPASGEGGWMAAVCAEVRAAAQAVLMIDRSADFKLRLRNAPLAAAASQANWMPLPGRGNATEALTRLFLLPDGALLTASPDQETRVREWLRVNGYSSAGLSDSTSDFALWEFYGPRRHELLRSLYSISTTQSWPTISVFDDSLLDSSLLLLTIHHAMPLWEALINQGAAHGLRIGGHLAEEAIRISRGVPQFGREMTSGVHVRNAFPEKASTIAVRQDRTLVALSSSAVVPGFGSDELMLQGERIVGHVSSRVCMPGQTETLLLALLEHDGDLDGLTALIQGRPVPVVERAAPATALLRGGLIAPASGWAS